MNKLHDNRAERPVALVTGAARRIGRRITERLHAAGYDVVIHCRSSTEDADALVETLNTDRPDSATRIAADLTDPVAVSQLAGAAQRFRGRLDLLVNNASGFYPTPLDALNDAAWHELMGSNLRGPLWLAAELTPALTASGGNIVNIVDIHVQRGLRHYAIYCAAKAGLMSVTRSLARELGPTVRVNGIAPGAILWPEYEVPDDDEQRSLLARTALGRMGDTDDIASAVLFLAGDDAAWITGQVLAVDGGAHLY